MSAENSSTSTPSTVLVAPDLAGKIALVTGGSRGIGEAVCLGLAQRGATVIVNYSSRKEAAEAVAVKCGHNSVVMGFNIASSEQVNTAFDQIKQAFGRLDILVNNAGITKDGLFIRMKDEDWSEVLRTNLDGTFYCSRAAAKMMIKARVGRIINISSVVGEMGNPGQASYVASKAGMIGLTKALAKELASRNITVNAVAPGFIETDMTLALNEAARESHMAAIPLSRFGTTEDVSAAVAFLAGPNASYITGHILSVNGGLYM